MTVESAADRLAFLNVDDFGVEATYTPAGDAAVPAIVGIFNDPHLSVAMDHVNVSDSTPTFTCRSADLPGAAAGGDSGDRLIVDGVTYSVTDLQPDGTGITIIILGAT